jgi:hypothetical protein
MIQLIIALAISVARTITKPIKTAVGVARRSPRGPDANFEITAVMKRGS